MHGQPACSRERVVETTVVSIDIGLSRENKTDLCFLRSFRLPDRSPPPSGQRKVRVTVGRLLPPPAAQLLAGRVPPQ